MKNEKRTLQQSLNRNGIPTPNDDLVSFEVNDDGSATFRLYAPDAEKVKLGDDIRAEKIEKADNGVCTMTTAPNIAPSAYRYFFNVDTERIGAYGHSAGAHLALMLAMVPKTAGLEGDGGWDEYSSRVNVAAAGSPPTELGRNTPMSKKEWWPTGYIAADHPPLFLIQGINDPIVRPELTCDFVEKMKAVGANLEYLEVEGQHGVAYNEQLNITEPALEAFFAKHLNP